MTSRRGSSKHADQDELAAAQAKREKQDYDNAKTRLVDQHWIGMKKYPDPLLPPRRVERYYPPGVTPEMEQRWLDMIRAHRAKQEDWAAACRERVLVL